MKMKSLLITGANRGIGLEFCRQYAEAGWQVWACCRQPEKSEALNKLKSLYPALVKTFPLEVTDHAQIEALAQTLDKEAIDLLINNAGIMPACDVDGFAHVNYAEWLAAFNINTLAPLKMAETFVKHLARSQQKTIVTLTSLMGSIADNGTGGYYLYRSSKAASNMVIKSLALDLSAKGINAIALHPGWVKTDMGGPNAMLSTMQSVSGMRKVITNLTPADSGKFFDFEGHVLPW
jgi:NAD(P)-dependent dehydrogenase (short-subunit alcohol dehydrogenase family)